MRFPRNTVSQCSRCSGGLLGSKQASLRLYLLPAPTLQSAGATAEHTSRKLQIGTREHTQHFHVAGGGGAHKTGFDSECSETPKRSFSPLLRPLG